MKPRYCVPITRREALDFMQLNFGEARLPRRATFIWVAGVHQHCDAPGLYLQAGAGGMQGVLIIPKAQALEEVAS